MEVPVSTYRLQLHASSTFKEVENIVAYLHQLGISTLYASPFFAAAPGSMHGYDVSDPHTINSEIGTMDQLLAINQQLQQHNMSWLQDIVPNHMVFAMGNQRLADVLERGPASPYYNWFDVDWQHPDPDLHGRLMVPFLGKPLHNSLQDNEIKLALNGQGFVITYFDKQFPLSVKAYNTLRTLLPNDLGAQPLAHLLQKLQSAADTAKPLAEWQQAKQALIHEFMANESQAAFAAECIDIINNDMLLLQQLLQQQYYVLCFWQQCDQAINYRRFFAVNDLISLNIENEAVFNEYHSLVHQLYQQRVIQGVRIDHIDGLRDPGTYLNRLRQLLGNDCYVVVEKILEEGEQLPAQWPLQGTTGYEFSSQLNWLLTGKAGAHELTSFYQQLLPNTKPYKEIVFEKKQSFLQTYMAGDWENLVRYAYTLQVVPPQINREQLKKALGLFMCCLPVYRLYPGQQPLDAASQQIIQATLKEIQQRDPSLQSELDFLQTLWSSAQAGTNENNPQVAFLQRLMQFTGPAMAKGVEDTTFYVYNALLAHNEVGDTPDIEDYSIQQFHTWMQQRQQRMPYSLNATSTHDSKRGEDGRVRLLALTWLATDWQQLVQHWLQANRPGKTNINGQLAPALEDEYFIYQSVLSGFPSHGQATEDFIKRLQDYFVKAVREAKINSNWQSPNTAYEEAGCRFIQAILTDEQGFIKSFQPFFEKVQQYANAFSLSQALIKITAPGVPDVYQGCELWNTSYVDPDNRLPVDYAARKNYLQELVTLEQKERSSLFAYIAEKRKEGVEKLYVTWKALQCRKKWAALFRDGEYLPLYPNQECGIVAYARRYQQQWVLVIAAVAGNAIANLEKEVYLPLPENAPHTWTSELTGELFTTPSNLPLQAALHQFPVALLTGKI
jgi:(1->4)-alpha-D-glucan 1-alpha-D-glucosylmutase